MNRRTLSLLCAIPLLAVLFGTLIRKHDTILYAQTYPAGTPDYIGTNYLAPASLTGAGGLVTGSSLVATIATGGVYCPSGAVQIIPQSQITFPASSGTYLIYHDCTFGRVAAKLGVVGPGSPVGQPGVPNTILTPGPTQIALATVVVNASTLTITDARVISVMAQGISVGQHLLNTIANGDLAGSKAAVSGTMTVTFSNAYKSAPVCLAMDFTTPADNAALVPTTSTTALTVTGATTTDVIKYVCAGNPN